jgi:phosphate starvation-inducible protein PhoH and related proteins
MSKRRAAGRNADVIELSEALLKNGKAMHEGPTKRKNWTLHDLKQIKPLTPTQQDFFHDFLTGQHICAHGSAGTGKTYLAVFLALNELLRKDSPIDQIIIVRSAVATRDVGFLKGTLEEKTAPFELPYKDMFADLLGRWSSYDDMKEAGKVIFTTTSYIRGLTWDNAIVIVDEAENMTFHELNSIMTRLGMDSRIIVAGDLVQSDLAVKSRKVEQTGLVDFIRAVSSLKDFSTLRFTTNDIVRSKFVRDWIVACEALNITS